MKKQNLVLLFVILLSVTGCADRREDGKVLARFDGEIITEKEFVRKMQSLPREMQKLVSRHRKDFLQEIVNEHYLAKEAKKRKLEAQTDVKDLLKAAHDKIMVSKLVALEVDSKVSLGPDEAVKYYEAHREEFMTPMMVRASHILVKTEDEARKIKADLTAGADFEEQARKLSIDNTALRGGDLGFFQKGQLAPEFEEMVFKMKKGDISEVFKTSFGYHIAKLTDRAEPAVRQFGLVRPLVERQLLNQKRTQLFKQYMEKVKGTAKVNVDEKALEEIVLPGDAPLPSVPTAEAAPEVSPSAPVAAK